MKIPVYSQQMNDELYNDQLNRTFQDGLSDDGWTLPQQSSSNITTISADMPNGTMWYDNETHEFKVKVDGTVQVVTTT